ncbi:MAG TPA: DNA repair protein RecO [Chlamydiales bacterium]|nr:DNA repair protein RecO [Chlamydiales bacterium]
MHTKNHGVLLHAIPYLGKGCIFKVFTKEAGLITLMSKKQLLSPFCIAEWVYQKKKSEIFNLLEGSIIDGLIELRQSYTSIRAAGSIARDLLRTQLPSKCSPALYDLFCSFLKKITVFKNPFILAECFRLKLLIHEGLLALATKCIYCSEEPTFLSQGESVCPKHASLNSILFSREEWLILYCLTFSRKFSLLATLDLPPSLEEKIALLFEEQIR